jgi:hypothetical protein
LSSISDAKPLPPFGRRKVLTGGHHTDDPKATCLELFEEVLQRLDGAVVDVVRQKDKITVLDKLNDQPSVVIDNLALYETLGRARGRDSGK